MRRVFFVLLAAIALLIVTDRPVDAKGNSAISASNLGFLPAKNLADTPVSSVVSMEDGAGHYYDRLTVLMAVTWGTSNTMNVKMQVSSNGVDFYWVQRCTSAAIHNCGDRIWRWTPSDGTTPALDVSAGYPFIRLQFDDPNDGTGTIVARAIRSEL
jgi:hypothetical protein